MPEVNSVKIFQTPSLSFEEKQLQIEELRAMIEGKLNVISLITKSLKSITQKIT